VQLATAFERPLALIRDVLAVVIVVDYHWAKAGTKAAPAGCLSNWLTVLGSPAESAIGSVVMFRLLKHYLSVATQDELSGTQGSDNTQTKPLAGAA